MQFKFVAKISHKFLKFLTYGYNFKIFFWNYCLIFVRHPNFNILDQKYFILTPKKFSPLYKKHNFKNILIKNLDTNFTRLIFISNFFSENTKKKIKAIFFVIDFYILAKIIWYGRGFMCSSLGDPSGL